MSFSMHYGTCSLCGGPVSAYTQFSQFPNREEAEWHSAARCYNCGAVADKPEKDIHKFGPIIQMRKITEEEFKAEIRKERAEK